MSSRPQQAKSYTDIPSMSADPANISIIDRKGQFRNQVDIDAEIVPFPADRRAGLSIGHSSHRPRRWDGSLMTWQRLKKFSSG